jgi:adenosine kinase
LPMWDAADLIESIEGCAILICNDYEFDLILKKSGLTKQELVKRAGSLITTLGELGSQISTEEKEIHISVAKATKVEDPTGAGDAYRGGLISGLAQGKDIVEAAKMGSVCASFTVEHYGTQEYRFTLEEFNERLKDYQLEEFAL